MKYLSSLFFKFGGSTSFTIKKYSFAILHTIFLTIAFSLLPLTSFADTSNFVKQINYQGKLNDSSGTTVADGNYNMQFKLYNSLTGGSAIWTGTFIQDDRVAVSSGQFSVMLGATSTSLADIDFNQPLYLSVNIGGTTNTATPTYDGEMTPRKTFGSAPHALNSDRLDGLDSTAFVRTWATSTIATSSSETLLTLNQLGAGNILSVQSNSTAFLTVTNAGRLGVGTSTPGTAFSVVGNIFASSTATSTFQGGGINLITAAGNTGCFAVNGTCVGGGTGSFTSITNTGTLSNTGFATLGGGASTTLLSATQFWAGGTGTTTITSAGWLGVGTSTPGSLFSVSGVTNFTSATSSFYGTGGIDLTDGCFSVDGTCIGGSGQTPWISNIDGGNYNLTNVNQASTSKLSVNTQFWAGGTGTTTITSAGWLGVGTSTPGSLFSVHGNSLFSGNLTLANITATGSAVLPYASSTSLTTTSSAYFATTAGSVGVGSTTPWGQLSVNPNALGSGNPEFVVGSTTATRLVVTGAGFVGVGTTTPWGGFSINPNNIGSGIPEFVIGSSTATHLMVTGAGWLGVGTSTPGSLFSVNGVTNLSTATSSFYGTGGINLTDGCFSIDGACVTSAQGLTSSQWTTEGLNIYYNTGNVGIGTTSPYADLSVAGQVVGQYFTATSTTIKSSFIGGLTTGSAASQTPVTVTFSYTGSDQSFQVPIGVTEVTIEAWGAGGGRNYAGSTPDAGGGGYVYDTITVTPGESLTVIVGGSTGAGTASYGGGAAGGGNGAGQYGGSGGGRSEVTASAGRVVAGGGGGAGANAAASGGAGGGSSGASGGGGNPGNGATQSTAGSGGGFAGSGSAGGAGGGDGGGGGGGYFGGGGGGADSGGGGGSGHVVTGSGVTTAGSGGTPGNSVDPDRTGTIGETNNPGVVIITYTPPLDQFRIDSSGNLYTPGLVELSKGASTTKMSVTTQLWAGGTGTTTITSNGWVGIGTSTPRSFLDISATSSLSNISLLSVSAVPTLGATTTAFNVLSTGRVGVGTTTPWGGFSINPNNIGSGIPEFVVGSSTATHFIITGAGLVGIGTTTPGYTLHVKSATSTTDVAKFEGATGNTACTLSATTGIISCTSDARLKSNITPFEQVGSLDKILALSPSTFTWNESPELGTQYGFIAQELEEVFPHLVKTDKDTGYKSISQIGLMPFVVKAIQELKTSSDNLSAEGVLNYMASLGAKIEEGVAYFKDIIVENISSKNLKVESGVTTKDRTTGEYYCMYIDEGEVRVEDGECSVLSPSASTEVEMPTTESDIPPVITINGDNPTTLNIGDSYVDLGALITAPDSAKNLGIKFTVDGIPTDSVSIDTSMAGGHEVIYSATDQMGQTSTAVRIVNIVDPNITVDSNTTSDTSTTTDSASDSDINTTSDTSTTTDPTS